jgi:predicted  nucleic acid-binding Zn-ribbon protein
LNNEIEAKNQEIKSLSIALDNTDEADNDIQHLTSQIESLKNKVVDAEMTVQVKDNELKNAGTKLREMNKESR